MAIKFNIADGPLCGFMTLLLVAAKLTTLVETNSFFFLCLTEELKSSNNERPLQLFIVMRLRYQIVFFEDANDGGS